MSVLNPQHFEDELHEIPSSSSRTTDTGKGKEVDSGVLESLRSGKMEYSSLSQTALTLPSYQRLKGTENYSTWRVNVYNLAKSAGLAKYLIENPIDPKPKEITVDNVKSATKEERQDWLSWEAGDAKAILALSWNVQSGPGKILEGKKSAKECWDDLEATYKGTSVTMISKAITTLVSMKREQFNTVEEYVTGFKHATERLIELDAPAPAKWIPHLFISGAESSYPIWAERQRSNLRTDKTIKVELLMSDLIDDNIIRDKESKPTGSALASKDKDSKDKDKKGRDKKDKKKDKRCKNCGQPNPKHSEENCMATNTEKRKEWEAKTGKKWIPYSEYKKKEADAKKKDDDSDDDLNGGFMFKTQDKGSTALLRFNQDKWLADSGADNHVANSKAVFDTYEDCLMGPVDTAGGVVIPPGKGSVKLLVKKTDGTDTELILRDVVFMPGCPINLLSVARLMRLGGFARPGKLIYLKKGVETELCAIDNNLHLIPAMQEDSSSILLADIPSILPARKTDDQKTQKRLDIDLWHKRLGHLGLKNVRKTADITKGIKLKATEDEQEHKSPCEACSLAKPPRNTRKVSTKRVFDVFEKVWIDTFKITPTGYNGHKYGMIFTDEATHARWGYTFKHKGDAYECIKKLMALVKTQYEKEIKAWRLDGGREYSLSQFQELCDEIGSILEITTPHTPEQDAISERSIGIVLEKVRSVMIDLQIPGYLWPEIFISMIQITNRTATVSLDNDITPYEEFMNSVRPGRDHKPFLGHLRTLGCKTYVLIPKENRLRSRKLDPRAEVGILVGYEGEHIYRIWVPGKGGGIGRIVRSSHVRFDEYGLITDTTDGSSPDLDIEIPGGIRGEDSTPARLEADSMDPTMNPNPIDPTDTIVVDDRHEVVDDPVDAAEPDPAPDRPVEEEEEFFDFSNDDIRDESLAPEPPQADPTEDDEEVVRPTRQRKVWEQIPEYQRMTRSKTRSGSAYFVKEVETYRHVIAAAKVVTDEPQTLKEALTGPDAAKWRMALKREYFAIQRKKTWTLVKRSEVKGQRVLRGKLVFKKKRDKNGNILKYKVRWVVRGFEQQYGKDYDQTYAGVCKSVTWKIVLAIAAIKDWDIDQMDAVTAFLNSQIDGDVYVELPPDWKEIFDITDDDDYVCKLLMALYGLKQSPRLWQEKLRNTLIKLGFQPLKADNCVYINKAGVIIVTYVDDMLITGPNPKDIAAVKKALQNEFEMDDMGPATYFVGVRIVRNRANRTITLIQDAYIHKILKKYGFENCKSVPTPMATGAMNLMVTNLEQATKQEVEQYQSIMGSATYLATQTRADISFTCSVLSRFLVNPSKHHMDAAKWLLRYIHGTIYLSVVYGGTAVDADVEKGALHGYSDSDFAGDVESRKSTSGYVFLFAGGIISVQSKRQSITALSTTEAEYYGLHKAVMEATWLRYIFKELGWTSKDVKRVKIFGDNQASLQLTENPELHQRTKHIAVKYHYIREARSKGIVRFWYCPTKDMTADGLTKPLARVKHQAFVTQLGLQWVEPPKEQSGDM
jgi:hypothetical protein